MKAIETIYKGYRFRSRLEARWAVFFDTLGIEYRYEDERYDLDGVWYLPDFYLPQYNYFIEIKPDTPTREEREKAIKLCQMKRCRVLILFGDVWKDVNCHAFEPLKMKFIEDIVTRSIKWHYKKAYPGARKHNLAHCDAHMFSGKGH